MCLGGCTIASKTKINIFWKIFLHTRHPSGTLHSKIFQKTLILAFEAKQFIILQKWTFFRVLAHCDTISWRWMMYEHIVLFDYSYIPKEKIYLSAFFFSHYVGSPSIAWPYYYIKSFFVYLFRYVCSCRYSFFVYFTHMWKSSKSIKGDCTRSGLLFSISGPKFCQL